MFATNFDDIIDKLAMLNEESEQEVPTVEDMEKATEETKDSGEETSDENISKAVKEAIKPQVDIAVSTINSLKDAYADNCNNAKELSLMVDQIKNWEKTIRGACQSIVNTVNTKKLFKTDERGEWVKGENGKYLAWNGKQMNQVFSPKAFSWIKDNDSRDRSTLDLCAAIIVFYNSIVV